MQRISLIAGLLVASTLQAAPRSYTNPVIPGFYPDPSICRVGNDYYLANSSFEYYPGVPIFHSRDLVHWRQIGHALSRPSQLDLAGLRSSQGIYAPTLRCPQEGPHKGRFYMVTTNVGKQGNFVVHANDPAGPWSEPVWIPEEGGGIDPSLLFDDDGKVYFARQDGGEKGGVAQAEIDLATGKLAAPVRRIWNGTGGVWPEGPHLYKVNGKYHLLIAEGGTSYGHMITMARAESPWGPFQAAPHNPVFSHRDQPQLPIQATGHGDIVQAPDGRWWMVMLGTRSFNQQHHLGRETMLAPVTWNADGWLEVNRGQPLSESMTVDGLPAPHPWPQAPVRDDFKGTTLGLEWNTLRGPATGLWSLTDKPGTLRLKGSGAGLADIATPAFVGRRQQHLRMRAATELQFSPAAEGQYAGLSLRMNETHHYLLRVTGTKQRRVELFTRVGGIDKVQGTLPIGAGPVTLEVRAWPERYEFAARAGKGALRRIGSAPTADLSSEKAGGFTGVYIGLVASSGAAEAPMPAADFNWFDYQPLAK